MSNLTRKKVKVRGKGGKVYQRSMMVQAQAIGRRAGRSGKLHALNPWEQRHTEHVKAQFPKSSGSSGPGSSHSWLAHVVGAAKSRDLAAREGLLESFTKEHARLRSYAGRTATAVHWDSRNEVTPSAAIFQAHERPSRREDWHYSLAFHHGEDNIHEVHQDPRRWVR